MTRNVEKLTLNRLRTVLEAYGANPDRWPAAERKAALELIKDNAKAKALLLDAGTLDGLLDKSPSPKSVDNAFLKRLSTIPYQTARESVYATNQTTFGEFIKSLIPARGFATQGMALALAGILGIWLGISADMHNEAQAIQLDAANYLFDNPDLQKDLQEFQ